MFHHYWICSHTAASANASLPADSRTCARHRQNQSECTGRHCAPRLAHITADRHQTGKAMPWNINRDLSIPLLSLYFLSCPGKQMLASALSQAHPITSTPSSPPENRGIQARRKTTRRFSKIICSSKLFFHPQAKKLPSTVTSRIIRRVVNNTCSIPMDLLPISVAIYESSRYA